MQKMWEKVYALEKTKIRRYNQVKGRDKRRRRKKRKELQNSESHFLQFYHSM